MDSMDFEVASFVCAALPGSTSFTVPAAVLGSIPPTTNFGVESGGVLAIGAFSGDESTTRFSAPAANGGEIAGDFGYLLWFSKTLPYY